MLTLGSLFDGIGGFPLAAIRCGIVPVWASEIEKFPIEVTKHHFPDMLHVGDITKLKGCDLPTVDIVCGGSPCQNLSIARGVREGLAGAQSGLFMEQIRIIREMREEDKRRGRTQGEWTRSDQRGCPGATKFIRPRFGIWENVVGAFSSSDGEDFKKVLEEFVRIHDNTLHVPRPHPGTWQPSGGIVLGDEFSLAYRVLDAQWFNIPQRRRRIYLVADFGGLTAPQILFECGGLQGNLTPSADAGQGTSNATQGGLVGASTA